MDNFEDLIEKMLEKGLITISSINVVGNPKQVYNFINVLSTTCIEDPRCLFIRYTVNNLRN